MKNMNKKLNYFGFLMFVTLLLTFFNMGSL